MNEQFVDQYYEMNPETEDLLFDGTKLENGMVVLVGDVYLRTELSPNLNLMEFENAKRFNSWYRISEIQYSVSAVSFIATYEDETKRKIVFDIKHPWLVKKDSMPLQHVPETRGILPHERPSLTDDSKVYNLKQTYVEQDALLQAQELGVNEVRRRAGMTELEEAVNRVREEARERLGNEGAEEQLKRERLGIWPTDEKTEIPPLRPAVPPTGFEGEALSRDERIY